LCTKLRQSYFFIAGQYFCLLIVISLAAEAKNNARDSSENSLSKECFASFYRNYENEPCGEGFPIRISQQLYKIRLSAENGKLDADENLLATYFHHEFLQAPHVAHPLKNL